MISPPCARCAAFSGSWPAAFSAVLPLYSRRYMGFPPAGRMGKRRFGGRRLAFWISKSNLALAAALW